MVGGGDDDGVEVLVFEEPAEVGVDGGPLGGAAHEDLSGEIGVIAIDVAEGSDFDSGVGRKETQVVVAAAHSEADEPEPDAIAGGGAGRWLRRRGGLEVEGAQGGGRSAGGRDADHPLVFRYTPSA